MDEAERIIKAQEVIQRYKELQQLRKDRKTPVPRSRKLPLPALRKFHELRKQIYGDAIDAKYA